MCPWVEKSGQSKASLACAITQSCVFHFWYWLLNTLKPSLSPCYCRAGLRKEEPNTGNNSSLRFSSVHLLMARTPCSKAFVGVPEHQPVQASDEDSIFRCHWHLLMAVTPYPFSNKELCIQNISCPFWGKVWMSIIEKIFNRRRKKGIKPLVTFTTPQVTKVSQDWKKFLLRHIFFSVVTLYHPQLNSPLWEQTH